MARDFYVTFAGGACDPYNSAVTKTAHVARLIERDLANAEIDIIARRGMGLLSNGALYKLGYFARPLKS